MEEAKNGTSTYAGSETKIMGRIDRVSDVDGYTESNFPQSQREDGYDTDNDGIPDAWEIANGLDPNDPSDATAYSLDPKGYYTNIEVYANSLVEEIMKGGNADAESPVEEYYPTVNKAEGIEYYTGRIVERLTEDTPDDPTTGENGSITWKFDTGAGEQAVYAAGVAHAIASSTVSLGDNLSIPNTRTLNNIVFSLVQPATKQPAPTATDAVTFSFTVKNGYTFQPSQVSFAASRIGTDGGYIDVVYSAGQAFKTVVTGLNPNRNNNADMPYSQVSESVSGIPTSGGTHNVVFNIYNLGDTKQVGLANIIIEGTLTSPSGIKQKVTVGNHGDTSNYNLSGQRVDSSYKGIVIRNGRKYIQK
jgi:hypothetical protein